MDYKELTYIKLLLGRERLSEYNNIMDEKIISTFSDNINPLFQEGAEKEGLDIEEDKEDIWEVIVDEDLLTEEMKSSYMGIKPGLDEIYSIIEDCVLDLENKLDSDCFFFWPNINLFELFFNLFNIDFIGLSGNLFNSI